VADTFWAGSPSPYSPLFLRLAQGVAAVTDGDLLRGVLVLRALDVLAIAGCAVLLVRLATSAGHEATPVLWLAVANPLVLVSTVSAAHNDILMMVGLLAALALHRAGRHVLAFAVIGLAAQVKVVALLAALVLSCELASRHPTLRSQARALAGGLAVSAATFTVASLASGLGW